MLAACSSDRFLNSFWKKVSAAFKMRDMGEPRLFLGMEVSYLREQGMVTLSQGDYISQLVTKFGIAETQRPTTPIKSDCYKQLELSQSEPVVQDFPYRELVGALLFIMVCTRPDIAFAVSCLSQYFSSPRALHWETALRCLAYLKQTSSFGLVFSGDTSASLLGYSDSDWAGNPITRRSLGGHCIFFGNALISWSSKAQKGLLALSTTESEYIEMALAIRQLLFLQPTLQELGLVEIHGSTLLLGDNQPAISSVGNKSSKSQTKHIDVRLKFCVEVVRDGLLTIQYVPSAENIADIFTKPLPTVRFRELRSKLVRDVQPLIILGAEHTAQLLHLFST